MAESKLRELSTDFAVKIIRLCETIKGHYSLVNQSALPSDMEEYYSKEKQSLCRVVGFEISLLSREASL